MGDVGDKSGGGTGCELTWMWKWLWFRFIIDTDVGGWGVVVVVEGAGTTECNGRIIGGGEMCESRLDGSRWTI